jgi:hypothetical protein
MVDKMIFSQKPTVQDRPFQIACHDRRGPPRALFHSLVLTVICTSLVLAFALGLHPGPARSATVPSVRNRPMAGPVGHEYTAMAGHGSKAERASMAQTVLLDLNPPSSAVSTDQVFAVDVRIIAGMQPVDGAEIHLDFDPTYLQVVDGVGDPASVVDGGSALEVQILNSVDNVAGEIDYAAGSFSPSPPSDTFVLATIRFKALASTGGVATPVPFVSRGGSPTDVVYQTESVLGGTSDGSVTISGASGTLENPLPLECGTTETGNTEGYPATIIEYGECGGGFSGPEVVYALQLDQTQSVSITLDTAASLALIALTSPDPSDCWYVGGALPPETLPPATYYFVIDGFEAGGYTLQVECQAATQETPTPSATNTATATRSPTPTSPARPGTYENPLPIFCDQTVTGSTSQTVTGSTSGYEAQFSAYGSCGDGFVMPEVWYRLEVQQEADVYITVDSSLPLYAFLLGSHDPEDCLDSGSAVMIAAAYPQTYHIVVDGTGFGRFDLDIRCEQPANLTPTPSASHTGVPGSYNAVLPIVLRNWTMDQATPTHTVSPSTTSEPTWTPTPTDEPGPSPTPTATPTPAGTFQDPIPVACEELCVGNSTGYSATIDSYGVCGSGFLGPEVVYQLQIAQRTERLSVDFGAAVELRLLLLTGPSPLDCITSARPGSYLQLSNPPLGTYFIVVDGPTAGSYAFTAHCQTGAAQTSGTLSKGRAGQPHRYSPEFRSLPQSP